MTKDVVPGIKYATAFKERLLEATCTVEVVVDVDSGRTESSLEMKQPLGSQPAFRLGLDGLKALVAATKRLRQCAHLLDHAPEGALDHQLNYQENGCSLIAVRPRGRDARFILSIGLFHREGALSELDTRMLDEAIARLEALQNQVRRSVQSKP